MTSIKRGQTNHFLFPNSLKSKLSCRAARDTSIPPFCVSVTGLTEDNNNLNRL